MVIIVAVDDRNGMMFNQRRQSQDKVLREKILSMVCGRKLWMNAYSHKQFGVSVGEDQIQEDESFLEKAGDGEYCFVENVVTIPFRNRIEKVILFKWNRAYPGDFFFDIDLQDGTWVLKGTEDFTGSSHEKMTMEVYESE